MPVIIWCQVQKKNVALSFDLNFPMFRLINMKQTRNGKINLTNWAILMLEKLKVPTLLWSKLQTYFK